MDQTKANISTRIIIFIFIYLTTITYCFSQNQPTDSGKLVIVGGAMHDPAIFQRFMELAGGTEASIVVIPTAMSDEVTDEMVSRVIEMMKDLGVINITALHTKSREEANSKDFFQPILNADGVWFTGGRQWRIADSYLETGTQTALEELLKRGGVIGGSSAGATILGSYLARGDTKTNTIMMGDHEEGFGFLPGVAIDQHLLKRNRQFDLIEIIKSKPELLGIGIDENTAIVVEGNTFKVMGNGYVAIYDSQTWDMNALVNDGKFFLLSAGDQYNWTERKVVKWAGNGRDIFSER